MARLVIATILATVIGAVPAAAVDRPLTGGGISASIIGEYVPGEVVVRFVPAAPGQMRAAARADVRAEVSRNLGVPGTQLLTLPAGSDVASAVATLRANPSVLFAEPNMIMRASVVPDDPEFAEMWGLHNTGQIFGDSGVSGTADADIDAPEAWDITTGSPDVLVGIIDSGIAYAHPDLAANLWSNAGEMGLGEPNGVDDDGNGRIDDSHGWDFINDDNDPIDLHGHGTHVAGTIGAVGDNGTGVTGVAPNTSMVMARALDYDGAGTTAGVADAITYLAGLDVDVINMSLGGGFSQVISTAIANAPDVLFVVAAGNTGSNVEATPTYPCALTHANVICVAATDADDELASFSNFGATSVDLAAPGAAIISTTTSVTLDDVFIDDFSGGLVNWDSGQTAGTNLWETFECGAGLWCATDSLVGDYANGTDTWIAMDTGVSRSGVEDCVASYVAAYEIDPSDRWVVEASADGIMWVQIGSYSGTVESGLLFDDMPDDTVLVRHRLITDGSGIGDGVVLADTYISCVSSRAHSYGFLNGTSMATPHVTGVAALLLAADPTLTVAELKSTILGTVDVLESLDGSTVTEGRLNAYAALVAVEQPVANDDSYAAVENRQLAVAAPGVLGNDTDPDGDDLIVSASDSASTAGGVVSVAANGSFTYSPPADFTGADSFEYTLSDGVLTDTATVTIAVSVNAAPVAVDDAYMVAPDEQLVVVTPGVLANDTDAENDDLTVAASDPASAEGGAVAVAPDGSFTYDPPAGFTGADTFGYTVSDGEASDTATVTINVSVPPPPPSGGGGGGGGGAAESSTEDPTCPESSIGTDFADIDELSDDAVTAIGCLVAHGVTLGTSASGFSPEDPVSRWQMALFLVRLLIAHEVTFPAPGDPGFADVAGLSPETRAAIDVLYALEITQGTGTGSFEPDAEVTRWQMALFLARVAEVVGIEMEEDPEQPFTDLGALTPEARLAIARLAALEIAKGDGASSFDPFSPVSRWQMALFLTRILAADGVELH